MLQQQCHPGTSLSPSSSSLRRPRSPDSEHRAHKRLRRPTPKYSYKVDREVFIKRNPKDITRPGVFLNFINKTLKDIGLSDDEHGGVLFCYTTPTPHATWALEASTAEMAEKLMHLNGMQISGTRLELARHFRYTGPPPKYSCFEQFQEAVSLAHNKATAQQGTNRDETLNGSRKRSDSQTDRTNEETSENFGTTNELKREEAKSENKTKGSLSKQEEVAQALDLYVQKQELMLLQEVATWKKENNRLKKEFSKLARKYVSLKKHCGQVMEENEQLFKGNQEMEEGFQETSGTADQPIYLDDEPKVHIELVKAKQAIETAANENAELQAELLRVSGQLVTTQQEFADVQKNWHEQQQMMEQQKQIVKLNTKLEDTDRRFRDVAESLVVQTSESANERKQQRESGCLLQSRGELLKDTKNFQDSQIVKEETGFVSERKLERKKKTFRPERLETYDV